MADSKTLIVIVGLALVGCTTTSDPGWEGKGATPFDTAEARCLKEAQAEDPGTAREHAFTDCMARHGWTRPAN
ncbi:MAG: hypothetical protein R3200_11795 [Xanthomonadales bacterium]|nr:hypothetical protein [Xanthomonadales bacterium]